MNFVQVRRPGAQQPSRQCTPITRHPKIADDCKTSQTPCGKSQQILISDKDLIVHIYKTIAPSDDTVTPIKHPVSPRSVDSRPTGYLSLEPEKMKEQK